MEATTLASIVTDATTAVQGDLLTVVGGVVALLAVAIGAGVMFRWVKKAAKSS